ncbi:MAG: hypothetical protein HYS21_02085 [Deltaproteobacteria bacterium]|nr:hypothetical protein [Deltaproteobacteria bacterium]
MKSQISATKITRPSSSKVFLRKRIFRFFDENRSKKALWVCGPPGAGKTTLVNSYITSNDLECLWYQVDEGDKDIATFFYYLGLAAKGISSGKYKPLPHLTPEYLAGIGAFTRRYFREFFSRAKKPFLLVFDNFQEASSSQFHDVIRGCLEEAPESCRVIIMSRTEPPQAFARCLANQDMKAIGWDDLRLTDAEAKEIAKLLGHKKPLDDILVNLQGKAQGWVAGLLLMIERARSGLISSQDVNKTAVEAVFNYFMAEIFEKADEETQEFLLKTSFLPSMTLKMAESLSENRNAENILSELNSKHFFIEKRVQEDDAYQYHPLFREFLLSRAKKTVHQIDLKRIQMEAGNILSAEGLAEDAAKLFIESGDWKGLNGLILTHGTALLAQGRFQVLESWISSIPDKVIEGEAWLLFYRGLCRLPFSPPEARKDLVPAYGLFKSEEDRTGIFLSWSGVVDTFIYEWRDFRPLDNWIAELEGLSRKYNEFPSPEIEERVSSCMFSALMFRQPQHPQLPKWEEKVRSIIQNSPDDNRKMFIGYHLILFYLWTGQNAKAGTIINTLSPAFGAKRAATLPQLMWYFSEALYNYHISCYEDGLKAVEEGVKIAEETGIRLINSLLYGAGILNSVSMGNIELGIKYLNKLAAGRTRVTCFDLIFFHHHSARIALKEFDHSSALEHAKLSWKHSVETGSPFLENIMHYTYAYILIEGGKANSVPVHIAEIRAVGRLTKSALFEYSCLVMEAIMALKNDDDKLCVERFSKAIIIGKAQKIRFFPLLVPQSAALLCARALEAGFDVEYIKDAIRMNNLTVSSHIEIEEWPWVLRIYTLGRFEVWKDNKKIEFSRKAQQRPLDLLKALISFGGKNVPEEQITDALWPDSDGDMAHQSFATTLHRLRKLLGTEKAIQYSDGMLTIVNNYCWVDIWGFDYLGGKADSALKAGHQDKAKALVERAVELYKGHFLACELKEPWAIPARERLRDKFIKYIGILGSFSEESGNYGKALELYLKGIEVDELAEKFYQKLMVCHKLSGNRSEAIKIYNRCQAVLSAQLKIEPSKETKSIYRELLESQ